MYDNVILPLHSIIKLKNFVYFTLKSSFALQDYCVWRKRGSRNTERNIFRDIFCRYLTLTPESYIYVQFVKFILVPLFVITLTYRPTAVFLYLSFPKSWNYSFSLGVNKLHEYEIALWRCVKLLDCKEVNRTSVLWILISLCIIIKYCNWKVNK
jgi:hypothetical protein